MTKENHRVSIIKGSTEHRQMWMDAASSPLQEVRAVVSIQTVRHTAPALLEVMNHLYLKSLEQTGRIRSYDSVVINILGF